MGVCSASCSASEGSALMADGLRGGLLGAKDEGASALTERAAGDESGVEVASGFKLEVGEEEGLLCRAEFVTADFSGKGVVSGAGSCRVGVAASSGACSVLIITLSPLQGKC